MYKLLACIAIVELAPIHKRVRTPFLVILSRFNFNSMVYVRIQADVSRESVATHDRL
jgi:hypothetical protein